MFLDIKLPGVGSPPHYHEREAEWFYVLAGRPALYLGGRWRYLDVTAAAFESKLPGVSPCLRTA